MALPEDIQNRIFALIKRFRDCKSRLERLQDADKEEEYKKARNVDFISIFKDACTLVHEAETAKALYVLELSNSVQKVLSKCIAYAYGESEIYDFMPSWAHDNQGGRPLVEDHGEVEVPLPHAAIPALLKLLRVEPGQMDKVLPKPWKKSAKRHPKSSPLARFRPNPPVLTPTSSNPLATTVCDARCEVSSEGSILPSIIRLSSSGSFLALLGMTGYKNRAPALEYFFLDEPNNGNAEFPKSHALKAGLAEVAYNMSIDETRRLIFMGDDYRIKSYTWATPDGINYEKPLPTHTLNSSQFPGPIVVLPNGTLVRAGRGKAGVWDISSLETHGDNGRAAIGKKMDASNLFLWRGDIEDIELSAGSAPSSNIQFVDLPKLKPSIWRPLIGTPSTVLSSECDRETTDYGCATMDLEHGGKTAARYLGHGGIVVDFSVSAPDPQIFLTACHDGFARLYDVRQSLPALTIDACGQDAFCEAVALGHPDGIPIAFTGTGKHEQIKVWDIRARASVYELATGNNSVESLVWDSKRNCLYAATQCMYMDRLGRHRDYRPATISQRGNVDDDQRCWPQGAWHAEDYFGHVFDSGEHRIFRYAFKENPDPSILPPYGDAVVG